MNQKKCPKCGEMNPAEAVMCWACYTPLTGGAVASGAGGGAAAMSTPQVLDHPNDDKKPIAPWQIGVVAVALLIGVGFGVSQLMGGGGGGDVGGVGTSKIEYPVGPASSPQQANTATVDLNPGQPGNGTTQVPASPVGQARYAMVSPPNPDLPWGVMAIVPNTPNVSPRAASALAEFVKRQYSSGKWKGLQIYVFADRPSAQEFARFQAPRKSDALGPGDYPGLSTAWANCLVQYEVANGRNRMRYPNRSPNGWWNS